MIAKRSERDQAIELRKNGLSYREILAQIPVAKSTLSLWLKSVGLSKPQIQRLTEKRLEASRKGGLTRMSQRIAVENQIIASVSNDIGSISARELWLMGIMLYWAEGSKSEGRNKPGCSVDFINSDSRMIKIFVKWCRELLNIKDDDLSFSIYIHKSSIHRLGLVQRYWSEQVGLPMHRFDKIHIKRHNPKTIRQNIEDGYYGSARVRVRASTNINRKVKAWINLICDQCGIV